MAEKSSGITPGSKKEVALVLTDMVSYSQKTSLMHPEEIRDFIIAYHETIQGLICNEKNIPIEVEPSAGDGAIIIFESRPGEPSGTKCERALKAALKMAFAMEEGILPDTRIGIYCGEIIEAKVGKKVVKFGASFAVASRLEELCNYFSTPILMDKIVAGYQQELREHLIDVGKVTPKNFGHPIHLVTIYTDGVRLVQSDNQEEKKQKYYDFIREKNQAIESFCGNKKENVMPDFPRVRNMLSTAQKKFVDVIGKKDVATERILDYIREFPYPDEAFYTMGMQIDGDRGSSLGSRLFRLSKQLLKALDLEFYHALVVDTRWEEKFKLEWWKKGDTIIRIGDKADGIFYIDSGDVNTLNKDGELIATLAAGDIFGEMAYFSKEKRRNATIVANSDVVLRRISTDDFGKLSTIRKIFKRIAEKRQQDAE